MKWAKIVKIKAMAYQLFPKLPNYFSFLFPYKKLTITPTLNVLNILNTSCAKISKIALCLTSLLAISPAFAQTSVTTNPASTLNSVCSKLTPKFSLTLKNEIPTKYIYDTGYRDLTEIAKNDWEPYVDKVKALNLGFTQVEYSVSYSFDSQVFDNPTQTVSCAVPGVKIQLGFESIEVYVAREIVQDSCLGQEVLAHEKKHVQLYKASLASVSAQIEQDIKAKLKDKLFIAQTAEDALAQANLYLENFVYDTIQKKLEKARSLHSQIDTPQEYERMSKVCSFAARSFAQ